MSPRSLALYALLATGSICAAWAQERDGPPKTLLAIRTSVPPRIDGLLDDPVWQQTPGRDDFLQSYPGLGAAPTQRTALRVAYDETNLYFAILCYDDSPQSIEPLLTRRDRDVNTDAVEVDIDSYGDHRTALRFVLSAAGVQSDGALYNDVDYDPEWDGVWESRSRLLDDGWSAEMRIPLSQLPMPRQPRSGFGLQVRRRRRASNESSVWVYVPPWDRGEVSRYGKLDGMDGLRPGSRWEVQPFTVARRRTPAPGEEFLGETGFTGDAGMDLRYRPAPNSTLNATLNPDFGQVELDQVVLNLSTFETFYPEKRPFFVEGAGFFSTPFQLFYSRRIGQAPAAPRLAAGEEILHLPSETDILGAAKWTGKSAGGFTYGALAAVTPDERARVQRVDGSEGSEVAAPRTTYSVVRLKQDLLRTSSVGAITTLADRVDGRESAAAGVDWSLRLADQAYRFDGQIIRTRVSGENSAKAGEGGQLSFNRQGGLHWRWNLSRLWLSPDADFNALGFMARPDVRSTSGSLAYREDRPGRLQNYSVRLSGVTASNQAGADFDRSGDVSVDLGLRSFWSLSISARRDFAVLDDRETRGGPLFRIPELDSYSVSVFSDPRPRWTWSAGLDWGEEPEGEYRTLEASAVWRAGRHFELDISASHTRSEGSIRWVETVTDSLGGPHYIFGNQGLREGNLQLEGVLALTPDLSLQGSVQLFAASVDYSSFVELTAPDRLELTPEALAFASQPDFRTANLNGQTVLRWQYRPGSYLTFVVTRRQRLAEEQVGLGRSLSQIAGTNGETVALVKLSYWWNP
jgi:hypothetical protein